MVVELAQRSSRKAPVPIVQKSQHPKSSQLQTISRLSLKENYESILTHESLMRWVEVLKKAPAFAFDTETDSLNNIDARLIGLSFAVEPRQGRLYSIAS